VTAEAHELGEDDDVDPDVQALLNQAAETAHAAVAAAANTTSLLCIDDDYRAVAVGTGPEQEVIMEWPGGGRTVPFAQWEAKEAEIAGSPVDVVKAFAAEPFDQDAPVIATGPASSTSPAPWWDIPVEPTPTAEPPGPAPATWPPAPPTAPTPPVPTGSSSGSTPGGGSVMPTGTTPPSPFGALAALGADARRERDAKAKLVPALAEGIVEHARAENIPIGDIVSHLTRVAGTTASEFPNHDVNVKAVRDAKDRGERRAEIIEMITDDNPTVPPDQVKAFVSGVLKGDIKTSEETATGASAPGAAGTGPHKDGDVFTTVGEFQLVWEGEALLIKQKAGDTGFVNTGKRFDNEADYAKAIRDADGDPLEAIKSRLNKGKKSKGNNKFLNTLSAIGSAFAGSDDD